MDLAKLPVHAWFECVYMCVCLCKRERWDDDDSPTHIQTHTHSYTHVNADIHSLPSSLKTLLALLTDANCSQSAHQGSCQCTVKPDHTSNCLLISLQRHVTLSNMCLCVCAQTFNGPAKTSIRSITKSNDLSV